MQTNQPQNTNEEGEPPLFFNSKKAENIDKRKKFFLFIVLKLFSFFRLFKKIVVFLINQLKKIIIFIFLTIHNLIKVVSLYSYKSYFFLKKQVQKIFPSNQKISYLLSRYSIFFVTFIIIIVLATFDNLKAKEVGIGTIGQGSIFYHFLNENQEEFVEETGIPTTFNSSDQFLKSNIQSPTEEQEREETIITQGGTILVKPNISVTVETPQIRTKSIQYIIKAGDVISGIAKKFNVSVNTILWENNLQDYSIIKPGDELTILPVTGVSHKVGKGETLEKIAKKYKVDVGEILKINELTNDDLKIDQKIIIPGGEKYFPLIFAKKKPARKEWVSSLERAPSLSGKFIYSKDKGKFIWPTSGHRISQ
ncbi:MAG: LysM peptidoglycan-binding domain-containing protein, partial [bacterium]